MGGGNAPLFPDNEQWSKLHVSPNTERETMEITMRHKELFFVVVLKSMVDVFFLDSYVVHLTILKVNVGFNICKNKQAFFKKLNC